MNDTKPSELATQIKDRLFVNGAGARADRLVLTDDGALLDLGDWCEGSVIDQIDAALAPVRQALDSAEQYIDGCESWDSQNYCLRMVREALDLLSVKGGG